jgi:hypothetical protein
MAICRVEPFPSNFAPPSADQLRDLQVLAMKQDERPISDGIRKQKGVWRGKAVKGGLPVDVTLDAEGKVTVN